MSSAIDAVGDPAGVVLYVEDDALNQSLMESVLRRRPGVRLVVHALGADALREAVTLRPDLILLDRHLPDVNADTVLQHLHAHPDTRNIPIVIVSGDVHAPRTGEAALGVVGYLTKPYDIRELLAYVDRLLGPASR